MAVRPKQKWLLEDLLYNGAEKDAKHSLFNHPMTFAQGYHHVHFTGKETETQKGEINCPRVTQFLSHRPTKNIPGLRDRTCRLLLHSLSQMIPDKHRKLPLPTTAAPKSLDRLPEDPSAR